MTDQTTFECDTPANALAPSLADIDALARQTLAALPAPWAAASAAVALRIEDFASEDLLEEMDVHDPFELTGLYEGIPLTQKSVTDQPLGPDVVWLFRRAILDEWIERGNVSLQAMVSHVLIHELAHHFGWSDADIAKIDRWWE